MDMVTDDSIAPATSFGESEPQPQLLSYDESVPYEHQVGPETDGSSLASRISRGKIYLLSETAGNSVKRKTDGPEDAMMEEDEALLEDPDLRPNAIFLSGPPISFLPTGRIFAYATHFNAHPLGLEWVSDTTCVLVFSSNSDAKKAFSSLQKSLDEESSIDDGSVTAKPIPVPLWPADERISRTLGLSVAASEEREREKQKKKDGLSGPLRMRVARKDDVKKKGARKESEFYRKHGQLAGKETINGRDMPTLPSSGSKRRRDEDPEEVKARLDRELDDFLAAEDDEVMDTGETTLVDSSSGDPSSSSIPQSPPSKMRSDYIADDGRTRIEKNLSWPSAGKGRSRRGGGSRRDGSDASSLSLSERIQGSNSSRWTHDPDIPEQKRHRGEGGRGMRSERSRSPVRTGGGGRERRGRGGNRTEPRPKKTQQELDDELDAFLNGA